MMHKCTKTGNKYAIENGSCAQVKGWQFFGKKKSFLYHSKKCIKNIYKIVHVLHQNPHIFHV